MAHFPEIEVDVSALASSMMTGYGVHATDFPSADVAGLTTEYSFYMAARDAHAEATAAAHEATEAKNAALDSLELKMRGELKKSEADTASDPEKLEYIGWGSRVTPTHALPPGQPRNLDPVIQGPGTLFLDWKSAPRGSGGSARSYIIERREEPSGGGEFSEWTQIGVAIESEATLTNQPRGVQMEYRVKGINKGGESPASNVAPVVL